MTLTASTARTASGTGQSAVDLEGVVKRFGTVTAVNGIDLHIRPGEVVALLGPNGAGKTTTVDMILGFSPPTSGTARVFGRPPQEAVALGRGLDGISAARLLNEALPHCRVLMVTTFGRAGYLRQAMAAGASGFVVKDTPARQLADAVRRVYQGLRVVDPALAAQSLAHGDSPLTERETDVLRAARDGGTVADIARDLGLSEGTVRNHLSAAIGKTGARTRAEAVRLALDIGWLLT